MPNEKVKKFVENKELRDNYIKDVTEILNKTLKDFKINKKYDANDFIKTADDKKKQENYLKCNSYLEEIDLKRNYARELKKKYNIETFKGCERFYFLMMDLPKDGDNIEEIEKNNLEKLNQYSVNSNIEEKIKGDLKTLFECDKTTFYPTSIDEAIENYYGNMELQVKSFIISSYISSSQYKLPKKLQEAFDYYKPTLESGGNNTSFIEGCSSEVSMFLPEDIPGDVLAAMQSSIDELGKKYDLDNPSKKYSYSLTLSYKNETEKENNQKKKEFFKEHDKNGDFIYKYTIGGETFEAQFDKLAKENKDIKIEKTKFDLYTGFNTKLIDPSLIQLTTLPSFNDVSNNIYSGEKDILKISEKLLNLENNNIASKNYAELAQLYVIADGCGGFAPGCDEFIEKIDKLVTEGKINGKIFDCYKDVIKYNINPERIKSLDENGLVLSDQVQELKVTGNPKIDLLNRYSAYQAEIQYVNRAPNDSHYSDFVQEDVKKHIEYSSKSDICKEIVIDLLNLDKNSTHVDCINALRDYEGEIPSEALDEIDKKYDLLFKDIAVKDEFEKLSEANKNEKEKLETIKEALTKTKSGVNITLMQLERAYEKGSLLNTNKDYIKKIAKDPEIRSMFPDAHSDNPIINLSQSVKVSKDFAKADFQISKSTSEAMLKVVNKMKELGIYKKEEINPQLLEFGEESTKIYGYRKFALKNDEVKQFVMAGKLDEAYKASLELKDIKDKYNELFDLIEEVLPQDGKHIPGNVSCLRNPGIPFDLQNRVQAQSQMNGIYNLMVFCEHSNISIEYLINNPDKAMKDVYKKKDDDRHKQYSEGLSGEKIIKTLKNPETYDNAMSIGRAFEILTSLETDQKAIENNAICNQFFTYMISTDQLNGGTLFGKADPSTDSIKISNETVRDYIALSDFYSIENFVYQGIDSKTGDYFKKEYDYNEFIKNDKRSPEEVYLITMDKITEMIKEIDNGALEDIKVDPSYMISGAQMYFKDYIKEKNLDPTTDKTVLDMVKFVSDPGLVINNYLSNENPDLYKEGTSRYISGLNERLEETKEEFKEFNAKYNIKSSGYLEEKINSYKEVSAKNLAKEFKENNKNFKENIYDNIAMLAETQRRYDDRSGISKIFSINAGRERRLIKQIKKEAIKNGIDKEKLDSLLDRVVNEETINDFTSLAKESSIKEIESKLEFNMNNPELAQTKEAQEAVNTNNEIQKESISLKKEFEKEKGDIVINNLKKDPPQVTKNIDNK